MGETSLYHDKSRSLLLGADHDLYTSIRNLSEFIAVVTKPDQFAPSMDDALGVVEGFRSLFTILYSSEQSLQIYLRLLEQYKPVGPKIYDYEIASIALAQGIDSIATVNKKNFAGIAGLRISEL